MRTERSNELIKRFAETHKENEKTMKTMRIGKRIKEKGYAHLKKELLELVKWKFPIAIGNVNAPNNTEEDVKTLTRIALSETLSDSQRVRILMGLTGIKTRMASAILTLICPERYGTFDVNARQALEKLNLIKVGDLAKYTIEDYIKYLNIIREIARKNNCTPRDIDRALYYYGKHLKGKCPICSKLENAHSS